MKHTALSVTFGVLLATVFIAPAAAEVPLSPDNISGTRVPNSVGDWTRLSVLGLRKHLFLIIWISPQTFHREGFERLIVLSPREYGAIAPLARAYPCLDHYADFPESKALLVAQYSAAEGVRRCRLPSTTSCEFLSKLENLPGINGIARKEEDIRVFAAAFGCPQERGEKRK